MDINSAFTRLMLRTIMVEIKLVTTPAERKRVWVYKFDRQTWEFQQAPPVGGSLGCFYWYGSADNAADARYQGWSRWLYRLQENPEELDGRLGTNKERYLWLQRGHALWGWDMEQARLVKVRERDRKALYQEIDTPHIDE